MDWCVCVSVMLLCAGEQSVCLLDISKASLPVTGCICVDQNGSALLAYLSDGRSYSLSGRLAIEKPLIEQLANA